MSESATLYHYTKENIAYNILLNKRLKLSSYDNLNDEFELQPINLHGDKQKQAWQSYMSEFSKDKGFVSFSETWQDPVMWGQYAENGAGICLGFEVSNTIKMNYEDDLLEFPKNSDGITEDFAFQAVRNKFSNWNYEKERRLIVGIDKNAENPDFFSFNDQLILKEILIGVKSKLNIPVFRECVKKIYPSVHVVKVKRASRSFKMVKENYL